jgi:hypothetical protein
MKKWLKGDVEKGYMEILEVKGTYFDLIDVWVHEYQVLEKVSGGPLHGIAHKYYA